MCIYACLLPVKIFWNTIHLGFQAGLELWPEAPRGESDLNTLEKALKRSLHLEITSAPWNCTQPDGFRGVKLKICQRLDLQHPSTSWDLHICVPHFKDIFSVSTWKSSQVSGEMQFSAAPLSLTEKSVKGTMYLNGENTPVRSHLQCYSVPFLIKLVMAA